MVHAQEIEMQSETIGKLAEALAKAQGTMTAAARVGKGNYGHYATLDSVWDAARKPLAENGLAVTQATDISESGDMVMVTTLMHSSGEWIGGVYPIRPVQNTPQGMGSAITYARRYSLSAMLGLAADDDDDGSAASGQQAPARQANGNAKPAPVQVATGNGAPAVQNGDDSDKPSDKQQKALHAKGMDLYGSKELWTIKRAELVKAVTKGRSESANDLTKPEMKKLLDGLDAKIKARDAEDAADEMPEGNPFEDAPEMAF